MKVKDVLKKEILKIKPNEREINELIKKSEDFCKKLEKELKRKRIKADVFVGGSLAKKTILKRKDYDIDIFVRFDKNYDDKKISKLLTRIVKGKKIHGSRDYIQVKKGKIIFEAIPIIKISHPKEARNVTDLSYFHVSYVRKKIKKNPKLVDEILLAKQFCHANKVYGAESHIRGFSGYAIELLIIYYKSFLRFIKSIIKREKQIIIDMEKHYKNKSEILNNLNEAKLQSPIIFIDPTFKERNVLAGLSEETFEKFKEACKNFLKNPNKKFFEEKEINIKKYNFCLKIKTNRQEGAIAGSKLLKFHKFLKNELLKYFDIKKEEFEYKGEKKALSCFNLKRRKEKIIEGPPITAIRDLIKFKKKHKNCFIKKNRVYAKEKIDIDKEKFLKLFLKKNKKIMKEMGIVKVELLRKRES